MAAGYIVLALVLAFTLNAANRGLRAAGTWLAALGLVMIASSIGLADFDGTFAAFRPAGGFASTKPAILNAQAIVAVVAAAGLAFAGWQQMRRTNVAPLSLANTADRFGLVARVAHWTTAVLILCLIPIGLFTSVLPQNSADRAAFLGLHQTLGLLIIPLAAFRLAWLVASPPPAPAADLAVWQRRLARATHIGLYGLILAFPLSGYLMSPPADVFGLTLPALLATPSHSAALLHDVALPLAFYALIALHLGAVLKHHLLDRRVDDVRRMLR